MSDSTQPKSCPQCGADLPESAPNGLCPVCLMAGAMEPTGPGDSPQPSPPSLEAVQAAFPHLEIVEIIGVGGMGVVYKARQTSLNRDVALKLLAPHRGEEPGFSERFTREAQALAAMNHSNIVTVHDFGEANGFYFLLMEFVDGVNLRQAMKAGKFSPEEALTIVPPICDALQYAHDRGVVHRDIKPENLLLDRDGNVKVADFGIARILNLSDLDTIGSSESEMTSGLTAGTALGTPNYMAPEQADSPENVDHRADIYSLGVVFYEMLTGERPSPAASLRPPSSKIAVDVKLDEIVLRALADSPELRWQSATDFATQVQTIAKSSDTTSSAPIPVSPQQQSVPKKSNIPNTVTIVLGLISIPFLAVSLIVLAGVRHDPNWTPNLPEAVFVFSIWIGALLLFGGTIVSFVYSLRNFPKEIRSRRVQAFVGIILAVMGVLLPSFFILDKLGTESNRSQKHFAKVHELNQKLMVETQLQAKLQTEIQQQAIRLQSLSQNEREQASEVTKRLKEQLENTRNSIEKIQEQLDHQPTGTSWRTSILGIVLLGLIAFALIISGTVLAARSLGGVAVGCGILLLVVLFGGVGLILVFTSYRVAAKQSYMHSKPVFNATPGKSAFQIDNFGIITTNAIGAKVSFEFQTNNLPDDWTYWLITRRYGKNHLTQIGKNQKAIGRGGSVTHQLQNLKLNRQITDEAVSDYLSGPLTMFLSPGSTSRILYLIDENQNKVTLDIEMRPNNSHPDLAPLLYIRESKTAPMEGSVEISWNEITSLGNHQIILETEGTTVYEANTEETTIGSLEFSRRFTMGDENLKFVFPPIRNPDSEQPFIIESWKPATVKKSAEGTTLFDLTHPETGDRSWARLKTVPAGTLEEIRPDQP